MISKRKQGRNCEQLRRGAERSETERVRDDCRTYLGLSLPPRSGEGGIRRLPQAGCRMRVPTRRAAIFALVQAASSCVLRGLRRPLVPAVGALIHRKRSPFPRPRGKAAHNLSLQESPTAGEGFFLNSCIWFFRTHLRRSAAQTCTNIRKTTKMKKSLYFSMVM